MDKKSLELDKILKMLAHETTCDDGAQLALALEPSLEVSQVEYLLKETDAAYVLMAKFGSPSFYGMTNVSDSLRRASAGGGLNIPELLRIGATLKAIRSLSQWSKGSGSIEPVLKRKFDMIIPNKPLEDRIFSVIVGEEEISDDASPELASIRRRLKNAAVSVRDKLNKIIHGQAHRKHLQEPIITIRSGRYVVPVKQEFRSELPGLIHDSSSSGATVFIEPMGVVETNNEIRILQSQEMEEIHRILMALSVEAGQSANCIIESYEYAVQLNLIFAKARLAYKMKGSVPKINDKGRINLVNARHPLINPDSVVPTDISLGREFDTLIITGPNTGGKTVSLKTLGLFTLMAMCGLMLPAGESEISVFNNIMVDIGDEQSIEQSLSTFSSHMKNIIAIMEGADSRTLVLLDELGAGTDPVEGAALAVSIIESLRNKGVRLACTTHYAELKAFAINTPGVENGCCEFDVSTLRPTYRLLIGVPGKSNAFAISQRLGMAQSIVERAYELISNENTIFEQVVGQLEEKRRIMENETIRLKSEREAWQHRAQTARRLQKEAEEKAAKEIDAAKRSASAIVEKTRRQADLLLNELEEIKKNRNKTISNEQKAKFRAGIKSLELASDPVIKKSDSEYTLPRKLKAGDRVLIFDIDKEATVLEVGGDGPVLVQAGIIKTRVPSKNLRLLEDKPKPGKRIERTITKNVTMDHTDSELDLRGKDVQEAMMETQAFLDHAVMRNLTQVRIIHGKGTGALRAAVQQELRRHPRIKSFRLGVYGEGESGVTIAEMKN